MKVLLTGASGFVGNAILRTLLAEGHRVVAAARKAATRPSIPGVEWKEADFMQSRQLGSWLPLMDGVEAVVNAVGIIRETAHLKFQAMHQEAPCALFAAAAASGVERLVQISASGVRDDSPFEYFTTKARAEHFLTKEHGERSLVLRPSLVYGEQGEASQLFRRLASLPVIPLPAGGAFTFRPIVVEDLALLVAESLRRSPFPTGVFEVGGAEILSLRQILIAVRAWAKGLSKDAPQWSDAPTMKIPLALMKPAAWGGDVTGLGPLDSDMLGMLVTSHAADVDAMRATFELTPRGLVSYLKENPR